MIEYAPGMRLIIRDEEWMIKKIDTNEIGEKALSCIGISTLVKDKEAIFLTDLEEIEAIDPRLNIQNRFYILKASGDKRTPLIRISILVIELLWT